MALEDGKSRFLRLGDMSDYVIENEERIHGHVRYEATPQDRKF